MQSRMPEAYAGGSAVGYLKYEKQTLQGPLIKSHGQRSLSTPSLLTPKAGKLHIICYLGGSEGKGPPRGWGGDTHPLPL